MNGQSIKINKQHDFKLRQSDYLDSIGIYKPNFNNIDFQVRVWYDNFSNGDRELIIFNKTKDNKLNGISLYYNCYNSKNCNRDKFKIDSLLFPTDWTDIWNEIISKDYLNISSQKEINSKQKKQNNQVLFIADGLGYTVEVISKKSKRRMDYYNPVEYYKFYKDNGLDIKEYIDFINFVNKIKSIFNLKFSNK